jgi:flagellar biosynthesis/type III secretory pathway chaperone
MDAITHLISKDVAEYQELTQILGEERQLLIGREFDAFTELLGRKHVLLQTLEQNNQVRVKLLLDNELPVDKSGLLKLFEALPSAEADSIQRAWALLNDLIDRCKHLNEINARIAHRAQATTHHVLNILKGEAGGFTLYGKDGTPDEHGKALPITRA